MKVEVENYRGIEFVRISSLPEDQRKIFWESSNSLPIIQILREDELLSDCLRKEDYSDWYHLQFQAKVVDVPEEKSRADFADYLKAAHIKRWVTGFLRF